MNGELIPFDSRTRRIWMFPRNIRDIAPWKLYQILNVLLRCENLNLCSGIDQQSLYKLFSEVGIKRESNTKDSNPGGGRTYLAQLACLGLTYRNQNNDYVLTLAGEAMADGIKPQNVLQVQLMRHQYPSAYGAGRNVMIDPSMKVKPFLFILKLLHDDRLERYLTDKEIMLPVIYGHTNSCYELVVAKIIQLRKAKGNLLSVVDDLDKDLYTPRGTAEKTLDNIKNIANTARNYLRAAGLVFQTNKIVGQYKYTFNPFFENIFNELMNEYDIFIPYTASDETEVFQRTYGRYDRISDERSDKELQSAKESPWTTFTRIKFVEFVNEYPFEKNQLEDFIDSMKQVGLSVGQVSEVISPIMDNIKTIEQNKYVEHSKNDHGSFVKCTVNILNILGFAINVYDVNADTFSLKAGSLGDKGLLIISKQIDCNDVESIIEKEENQYKYIVNVVGAKKSEYTYLSDVQFNIPCTYFTAESILALLRLNSKGWTALDIEKELFLKNQYYQPELINMLPFRYAKEVY